MQNSLTKKVVRMAAYLTVGFYLQCIFLSLVFASGSVAQTQKMSEISLKLNAHGKVETVFQAIENLTEFRFSYNRSKVNLDQEVMVKSENNSLQQILMEISKQTNLKFKRINESIHVTRMNRASDQVIEEIIQSRQDRSIRGKVTSFGDNEPLPGVNVVEKGTTNGTVTNVEGEYNLTVSEGTTLVFSSVGYTSEEVPVGSRSVIDMVMTEDIQQLQELVVIGYGEVNKSDLTGAVSVVKGDIISERQTAQVSQALQGTMPGVMVTRNNNEPGSSATIRIRGITTIGENDPLIILDGVPVNNIDDINPNDIENISVLKDAASASIYGSRAAAGVIVVTTKRAKKGQLTLSYNPEFGYEIPTVLPEFSNSVRYMEAYNERIWNDNGNTGSEYPRYEQNVIENYDQLHQDNPNLFPKTDWYGLLLKNRAPRMSHSLNISAGSESIKTNVSLVYDKIEGLYDKNSFERITARVNNDITINNYLSASIDLNYSRSVKDDAAYDNDLWRYLYISPPIYPAVWTDGRVAEGKQGGNIYGSVKYGGDRAQTDNLIRGRASIDFTPVKGFKISGIVAPGFSFDKGKRFTKLVNYYAWDDPTLLLGNLSHTGSTRLNENRNEDFNITTQLLANYSTSIGNHNISALMGYEYFYATFERLQASRDGYQLTSFPYLDLGPLELRDNGGQAWENAYRSYFGRILYNFNNRYYLQANIRYDGSSRFHEDYRWGSFPSVSGGWVISEEPFLKSFNALSFLKIRGSWGNLGNERIGNYPYQAKIGFGNALLFQGNEIVAAQTAAQSAYAIRNISWEKTESYDIGFDMGFFDDRFRVSGDYFMKTTEDMLLALEIPDYMGFENPDQNTGVMETRGWEAIVDWNDHIGELNYSLSFNISDFKSEMGNLGGTEFLGDQIKIEGSEFNEWYGYVSDGLFQSQDDVDNSPIINNQTRPGDVKYVDISGPEGIPDGVISPDYDRVLLGGSMPRYMYGGNIRLNYKNFDFSLVLQGVGKQNSRLTTWMVMPFREQWGNVPAIIEGKYWSAYNSVEENESATYPRLTEAATDNNYTMSDYWLFDGHYLRFKNATLGYNIPDELANRLNLNKLRAYVSVTDFLTLSKYPDGWDPELSMSTYPITTSLIIGLTVGF